MRQKFGVVDGIIYIFLGVVALVALLPFLYVLSVSLTDPSVYKPYTFYLIPPKFSLASYAYILNNPSFLTSLKNTAFQTVVGTACCIAVTFSMAFALTKRDLPHRGIVMGVVLFSMLFNPGIIPNYLNIKNLGLINSRWVLILPVLTNSFNLIVARSFLDSIPAELDESAKLDGCNDLQVFTRIILPLSTAALATMTLFFAVGHWNTYFNSMIYINDVDKRTLQVYVRLLIVDSSGSGATENDVFNIPSETLRLATVMLAMLPILIVYPFVQKYFVKGVMLGSVKG